MVLLFFSVLFVCFFVVYFVVVFCGRFCGVGFGGFIVRVYVGLLWGFFVGWDFVGGFVG